MLEKLLFTFLIVLPCVVGLAVTIHNHFDE